MNVNVAAPAAIAVIDVCTCACCCRELCCCWCELNCFGRRYSSSLLQHRGLKKRFICSANAAQQCHKRREWLDVEPFE
jgi:hypothetical protein